MTSLTDLKRPALKYLWVALAGLLVQAAVYRWDRILPEMPKGAHAWRQADALSMAMKFASEDLPLHKPAMHFRQGADGSGAGEFTLTYWLNGQLWSALGVKRLPWTMRLMHGVIWWLGLLALVDWVRRKTGAGWLGVAIAWLLQASPLTAYYGPGLMVNQMALGSMFIGWWALERRAFVGGGVALGLGMLFRPTMALALVGPALEPLWDRSRRAQWISMVGAVVGVGAWVVWSKVYNAAHETTYFLTGLSPMTDVLQAGNWSEFKELFTSVLLADFYPKAIRITGFATYIYVLLRGWRTAEMRQASVVAWLTFAAALAYIFLWFGRLNHHDYYLLDVLVLVPVGALAMHQALPAGARRWLPAMLLALIAVGTWAARDRAGAKSGHNLPATSPFMSSWELTMWRNHHAVWNGRFEGLDALAASGAIPEDAVLVCMPDASPNIALSRLDRNGFTSLYDNDLQAGARLRHYAERGATHFVALDPGLLEVGDWGNTLSRPLVRKGRVWLYALEGSTSPPLRNERGNE